jgi:putative two-component system response regulator
MRILIVDDNKIELMILRNALEESGHEVITAVDGTQALAVIRAGACRLVISDWDMPNMDGIQLCRAIRSEDLLGYVYMILLTGHNRLEERVAGLRAGADDFLSKPFDPADLLARVQTAERILSLETRDVAIFALARLAESRDPETGAHLERVRSYSRILAQHLSGLDRFRMEVNAEYVRLIYLTSPLHDIGKVGIPDSVLLKPGRLTDAEFEIMKTHTTLGAQTLDAAVRKFPGVKFLQMARDIAACHHERFDGTGYPHGFQGHRIPLCARIVAVADVFDALTSKRVYKDALAHDHSVSTIVRERGAHFDPDIVDAFMQSEDRFISARAEYCEPEQLAA